MIVCEKSEIMIQSRVIIQNFQLMDLKKIVLEENKHRESVLVIDPLKFLQLSFQYRNQTPAIVQKMNQLKRIEVH